MLDKSFSDIVRAYDEDACKPLGLVLDKVRDVIGHNLEILDVVHYCTYFTGEEFVIEYFLKIRGRGMEGVTSVKLLYTNNPRRLLQEYYRVEKHVCKPDLGRLHKLYLT